MTGRRHKGNTEYYRTLTNYKERMQSFNMSALKLREYVRVMLELDARGKRTDRRIVETSVERLEKEIRAIRRLL